MQHRAISGASQDRSAQEHLDAQGGRLPVVVHPDGALEFSQQVKQHQDREEGRLGGEELVQTEIIRRQAVLQFRFSTSARRF